MQETDMGGLLVNTMPVSKCIFHCLLKASNTKHDQFQEVKQWSQMFMQWVYSTQYLCLTKAISFSLGWSLKDIYVSGRTWQGIMHILIKNKGKCQQTHLWLITSKKSVKLNSGCAPPHYIAHIYVYGSYMYIHVCTYIHTHIYIYCIDTYI